MNSDAPLIHKTLLVKCRENRRRDSREELYGSPPSIAWITMIPTFEMTVEDTFFFQDGRVVFAGRIEFCGPEKVIRECDCEIVLNNQIKAPLRIEGEMRPKRWPGVVSSTRALSTRDPINLEAVGLERSGFTLRCTNREDRNL
ncbi:MAG: hypothetical protein WBG02_02320 [Candidatus Acidiferrum sp.]